MNRETIATAALMPVDLVLGAVVAGLKVTHTLDKIADPFYALAARALKKQYESQNDLKAEGLENIPAEGGVIFAPNHQSWNDVQVIGASAPRRIRFLAKQEFETWPILRQMIALGDMPYIRRGGDKEGLAQAVEALKAGKALCIFPEGTIPGEEDVMRQDVEPDTGMLRGHTGAVRLAIAAGVPIIPVGVSGTGLSFPPEVYPRLEILEAPKKNPITVRYGAPMMFEELQGAEEATREALRDATKKLMLNISALIDHEQAYIPIKVPAPVLPKHEKLGVLLLHGFTGSVRTVDGLVPLLDKAGITHRVPVLRGHGTEYTDLEGVTAQDWYDDAEAALLDLSKEVDKVVVIGLSMGGLVALNLGINHADKIAGVVSLAAALRFADPLAGVTPLIAKLIKSWPSPESFNDKSLKVDCDNYSRFMTSAFAELYQYAKDTEARLPELSVPICVMQSKKDQVVAPVSANVIYRRVTSDLREIHWFQRSGHEMGQDLEKDAVFETIMTYVLKHKA